MGIKTIPIQDTLSKPGSARQNLNGIQRDIELVDLQMDRQLRRFPNDEAMSQRIRDSFERKRAPLLRKLQAARATFK